MQNKRRCFAIVGIVWLAVIGCVKTGPSISFTPSYQAFASLNASELAPVPSLAIQMDRMAKQGSLPLPPYIDAKPSAITLDHWDRNHAWLDQNVVIMDIAFDAEGVCRQRMLVEATDRMGRIDLRDDRIAYAIRSPRPDEAAAIANMFRTYLRPQNINRLSASEKDTFSNFLKEFQRNCGLTPDGLFGPKTAGCMGQESAVVDLYELTSKIVYPATPRHAAYVVPKAAVDLAPQQYYQGFDSLETVKQNAVDPKSFAAMANEGAAFVAFVYFFDRVDPHKPLCLRIGPYQKKTSGAAGQQWHAAPGKWPVVVETFAIDKATRGSLYLNVSMKDGRTRRCIGSHRLQ